MFRVSKVDKFVNDLRIYLLRKKNQLFYKLSYIKILSRGILYINPTFHSFEINVYMYNMLKLRVFFNFSKKR